MDKVQRKHSVPTIIRIILAVLFLAGISILITWFVFWRQNMGDMDETWAFINEKPVIFWYSGLLVFLCTCVISEIAWGAFLGAGISFSVASVITYVHMQKFQYRAAPLLPEDFAMADQAGDLIKYVDIWGIVRLVGGIVLIMIAAIILEYNVRKVLGRRNAKELPWWERFSLIPRVSLGLVTILAVVLVADPVIRRGDKEEHSIPWLGIDFEAWNQNVNYERNGFIVGFLYNLGRAEVEDPEDYTEEKITEIAKYYQFLKDADSGRVDLADKVDNLIIILDESFYDPELLDKYYSHVGGDPLPNLRKIFQKYPSGYMYSPEYGGGTANVEFEVISGLSNYWANTTPFVEIIPKLPEIISAVGVAKDAGFDTTAIHANQGSMYKRNLAYPKLGYDVFLDEDKMTHTERENGHSSYISDGEVYQEVLDVIKENKGKQMVGVATMQNHTPYMTAWYDDLDYWLTDGQDGREEMLYNFQSLHSADNYLGEFLAELDKLDEKTVVLWFGDHAAALLDDYIASDKKSERDLAHLTPYFIYTNFEVESIYTEKEVKKLNEERGFSLSTKGIDLPVVSPNCLANTMFDILGAEKPSLYYLVGEVCEEVPILTRAYLEDSASVQSSEVLKKYELVNYDILHGEYYWPEK